MSVPGKQRIYAQSTVCHLGNRVSNQNLKVLRTQSATQAAVFKISIRMLASGPHTKESCLCSGKAPDLSVSRTELSMSSLVQNQTLPVLRTEQNITSRVQRQNVCFTASPRGPTECKEL